MPKNIFKLPHNCIHFTCQQGHAQNPSSQASTVCELRTSRCTSWIQKRQRNQRSNCQHPLDHQKSKRIQKNIYFCFVNYAKAFDCVAHNNLKKILQEMGIPHHLTRLLRNLYAAQEAMVSQNQELVQNWERSTLRLLVYCHLAYLTSMQSTSCTLLDWMNHNLESRLPREISTICK